MPSSGHTSRTRQPGSLSLCADVVCVVWCVEVGVAQAKVGVVWIKVGGAGSTIYCVQVVTNCANMGVAQAKVGVV